MRFSFTVAGFGIAGLVAAAGLCFAPGCGGSRQATPVNTGLASLLEGDPASGPVTTPDPLEVTPAQAELYRLAEESAANLQSIFDQMGQSSHASAPSPPTSKPAETDPAEVDPTPAHGGLRSAEAEASEAVAQAPSEDSAEAALAQRDEAADDRQIPKPESLPPLAERIRDHTIILVDLLRQQSLADESPFRTYLALAAMEVLWPGALQKVITPSSSDGALPPDQLAAIEAFGLFTSGAARLSQESGSSTDGLVALAEQLIESRPLRIRSAVLCSRVTGFGQYTPIASTRFLHGRRQPVIIYAEVVSFSHREATSTEAALILGSVTPDPEKPLWSVELSQEVQVFHDVDGLLVWSRPEETVLETSRNRRRDFFLVNEIALPPTLSVGRYQMKVIMRDKTGGAVDEAIIPFEVVADPALARGSRD